MSGPLDGRVALVSGATRGGGRGIAVALGEAGATVYATDRSADEVVPAATSTHLPGVHSRGVIPRLTCCTAH
jgi:NAD(P)-dependent dehydrogenase (short-subunit alcohol dehydrogenase family)